MIFHLVLLATSAASPVPQVGQSVSNSMTERFCQGLTLAQFRQGARSLFRGGQEQEIKVEISPSYRKVHLLTISFSQFCQSNNL